MHYARLAVVFLAASLAGAFLACGTPAPKCSPASCSGCCAADTCVTTSSQAQCGSQGNACTACSSGTACEFGVCRTVSASGGGAGMTGGGGGSTTGGGGGATTGGGGGSTTGGGGGTTGGGGGTTGGGGGTTGGGGGATGGGGGTMVFDAGTPGRDGGTIHPPTVALTFSSTCGALTKCAGNEVGDWVYTAGCIDDSAFARVTNAAMQVQCAATVSNKSGSVSGVVVFDGTNVRRNVLGAVNFHLAATGQVCQFACSSIPGYLPMGITGTCAVVGTTCECDLSFDIGDNSTQTYTYTAGALETMPSGETFDSCITGNSLRYRQTSTDGGLPGVPGLFTLSTP